MPNGNIFKYACLAWDGNDLIYFPEILEKIMRVLSCWEITDWKIVQFEIACIYGIGEFHFILFIRSLQLSVKRHKTANHRS